MYFSVFLEVHAWISALSYATERAKRLEDHIILTWSMAPLVPRCHRRHRHLLLNKDNSFADALESIAEFKDLCVLRCQTLPVLAVPLQKKLAPLDGHRASRTIFGDGLAKRTTFILFCGKRSLAIFLYHRGASSRHRHGRRPR